MMKSLSLAIVACFLVSTALAAEVALDEDAKALIGEKGTTWQAEVLDLEFVDGSRGPRILQIEFASPDLKADASAKMYLKTAPDPKEPPGRTSSGRLGDGSFRDVRLSEEGGQRIMTITRSLKTIDRPDAKAERRLARSAFTFTYEIKEDELILKGFIKDDVKWGVTQFKLRDAEVKFTRAKSE